MRTDGKRRSDNFEDRGQGSGGGGGGRGGLPIQLITGAVRMLGLKGTLIVSAVLGVGYFVMPQSAKQAILGLIVGAPGPGPSSGGSTCDASAENAKACDFSRVVLASTEDVWTPVFG